jgi:hypothetical protein
MFLRKYAPQRLPPKRTELSLSTQVLGLENADPSVAALKYSIAGPASTGSTASCTNTTTTFNNT